MTAPYCATGQQKTVIIHDGSAFVTACPGAGKTRTMVERARHLAARPDDKRGVVFLSFTNAAVDELQGRLRLFGLLPSPLFPSFIGTFDRFLWQFFIAPFGIPGCAALPRLVPDKDNWEVKPFARRNHFHLSVFTEGPALSTRLVLKSWASIQQRGMPPLGRLEPVISSETPATAARSTLTMYGCA